LVRFSVDLPEGMNFNRYTAPTLSPDGERIILRLVGPESSRYWIYRTESTSSLPNG
jgi:hypothetical protein